MVAQCYAPIKARTIRLTKLDVCGVPVTGATSAQVVTDGFTRIANSPQYEEGERFLVLNADGSPCINQKDPNFLNWFQSTIDFCSIDPEGINIITGEQLITTGAPATGTGMVFGEGQLTARFALEAWQRVAGAGACDPSGLQRYVYWAFPNFGNALLQDFEFANGPMTFSIRVETKAGASQFTRHNAYGLTGAWPANKHAMFNLTTVAPPVVACGATTW